MDFKPRGNSKFSLSILTIPFLLPGISIRHSNMKDSGQEDMVEAPWGILWKGFLLLKERHMERELSLLLLDTVISENYTGVSESRFARGGMSGKYGGVGGP